MSKFKKNKKWLYVEIALYVIHISIMILVAVLLWWLEDKLAM